LRNRFILSVFLILLLLLAGCIPNQQANVQEAESEKRIELNNSTVSDSRQANQDTRESRQPDKVVKNEKNAPEASNNPLPEESIPDIVEPKKADKARLVVTRNYGESIIYSEWVEIPDKQDALSLTSAYLDVKTSYGGSFVNSINGLESGYTNNKVANSKKEDWFLYFNGVLAGCGAENIKVKSSDVVWWDHHSWEASAFTPAMIGAFPHPFTTGVVLAYSPSAREAADQLANTLTNQGIKPVNLQKIDEKVIERRESPVILLGLRTEINAIPAIQSLNSNLPRTGLFCSFDDTGFKLWDEAIKQARAVKGSGYACIEATATGMADPNPLWLVVAETPKDLISAVDFLGHFNINPSCAWGVILGPQGVISLPVR
jgi:hypothetical protein